MIPGFAVGALVGFVRSCRRVRAAGIQEFPRRELEGCESPGSQPAELGGGYEGRFFPAEWGEDCPRQDAPSFLLPRH